MIRDLRVVSAGGREYRYAMAPLYLYWSQEHWAGFWRFPFAADEPVTIEATYLTESRHWAIPFEVTVPLSEPPAD